MMKLNLIHRLLKPKLSEGIPDNIQAMYDSDMLKKLRGSLAFMPKDKIKHSFRVGSNAAQSGLNKEHVTVAILHDYIERGGDLTLLKDLDLTPHAIQIIKMLSIEEKTPGADDNEIVYEHIKEMLNDKEIDDDTKDIAIIIKCSDRLDNLRKRIRRGYLDQHYMNASFKLLNLLISNYKGNRGTLNHIHQKMKDVSNAVEDHGFNKPVKTYT